MYGLCVRALSVTEPNRMLAPQVFYCKRWTTIGPSIIYNALGPGLVGIFSNFSILTMTSSQFVTIPGGANTSMGAPSTAPIRLPRP